MVSVDKSGDRVRKMFAEIAPKYDLLNHLLSLNIDKLWRNKTVNRLSIQAGVPVLDVCTGTGDLALAIAKKYQGKITVVGSDFCSPMLEIARKKSQSISKDVTFVEADTQQLPFADSEFQAVTVAFGIRNVAVTTTGIAEMMRVCKEGGQIAILEFSRPTWPVLKQTYDFYFLHVLPRIGQMMAKNDQSAYTYLPESVRQFPSGEAMAKLMRECGLKNIQMWPMTFGIATLYIGIK